MKKLLSVLLSLLMVMGIFASVNVSAFAVDETTTVTEGDATNQEGTDSEAQPTYATSITEVTAKVDGVYVAWTCDGEADSYNVYRRAAGEASPTLMATVTTLNYLDKTVKNNVYYKYHIEAVVDSEIKATSEGVLTKYLQAVKITSYRIDTTGTPWVGFRWEPVTGAKNYHVYARRAGEADYKLVDTSFYSNYVDCVTLNNGYTRFAIVAVDGKYKGALDTNGPLIKFYEEPYMHGSEFTEDGVKIKWGLCDDATGYRVYRRAGGEKYYTYLCTTTESSYTDTTVESGKYYRYVVRAVYGTVFGPYDTAGVLVQYVDRVKLEAIANATDGVYVRWTPVTGAKKYAILRREAGGIYRYIATVDASKGNKYKDTSTVPLEYYRYTVEAISGSNQSSGYDTNGLFIKHNPLGTTWNKASILKYYNFHISESRDYGADFTMTMWQNVDSQSASGSNNEFVKEFKDIMAVQYIPANDPLVYNVTDDPECYELFPGSGASSSYVKSATISRRSDCDVITLVMKDQVSPENTGSGIAAVSDNYMDFGGVVDELDSEGLITSGTSKATYKNFTIVATFTKDGKLISATHSCKDVTASMDLNFIQDIGKVKYNVQFDTYLTYSNFKY